MEPDKVAEDTSVVEEHIDHMKRAYDMYTSDDWVQIIMERNNDY